MGHYRVTHLILLSTLSAALCPNSSWGYFAQRSRLWNLDAFALVYYKVTAFWLDRSRHVGHPDRENVEAEKYLPSGLTFEMKVLKPKDRALISHFF